MNNFVIPVGNKILVKQLKGKEEKSSGGLTLVNSSLVEAEVVSVSQAWINVFKKGDKILYPEKKGVAHIFGGEPYLFLDADPNLGEVYAII